MLTPLQERLAELFLSTEASAGFALAGGAALVATGVVDRPTDDLDFFVEEARQVRAAARAFEESLRAAGLTWSVTRSTPAFVRMEVADGEDAVLVDIAVDHRLRPAAQSRLGPVLALEELAADKVLALFGRAEARDFVDVYFLQLRHGIEAMLTWAREDAGFDPYVLATMIGAMDRRPREEFAVDDDTLELMHRFFWELRARLVAEARPGSDVP